MKTLCLIYGGVSPGVISKVRWKPFRRGEMDDGGQFFSDLSLLSGKLGQGEYLWIWFDLDVEALGIGSVSVVFVVVGFWEP